MAGGSISEDSTLFFVLFYFRRSTIRLLILSFISKPLRDIITNISRPLAAYPLSAENFLAKGSCIFAKYAI